MSDNIRDLGQKVELATSSTNKIVDRIKRDMYIRNYKEVTNDDSPEEKARKQRINKMIVDAYKKKTGQDFDYNVYKKAMPRPVWCMGPPGQGKTAAFLVAAKEFCDETGFRFVRDVTDSYVPNADGLDFPVVVQETAGENSAITFGGVPKAETIQIKDAQGNVVDERTVLKRALNYRFTVFNRCAGGLVLFDDAANASAMIQNVLLPVAQTNTFQGLKIEALIGFTGNLGALDGTHTVELSSALITRVNPYFIQDKVEDYIARGYELYNDELGDLGFLSYLKRNPTEFAELPRTGAKSGFACPRSHSNFIEGARAAVQYAGGRGKGENAAFEEIRALAYGCYGPKYAQKIISFYQTYIQGADPLAREAIVSGKLQKDKIADKYKGGSAAESMSFGYQFVTACGDYFVTEIGELMKKMGLDRESKTPLTAAQMKQFVDSKEFEELCQRYGRAVLMMDTQEFSFGFEHFKSKLLSYAPSLSVVDGNSRDMANAMGDKILMTTHELPECGQNYTNLMLKIIAGTNRTAGNFTIKKDRQSGGSRRTMD